MVGSRSHARFLSLLGLVLCLGSSGAPSPSIHNVEVITNQLKAKAVAENRTLALDDVLFELGKQFPVLRSNYILMHQSESRQKGSYEFPRVIIFTPDARFALSFNGDPTAAGYHELEMYEFVNDRFHFRRIIFQPTPDYRHRNDYKDERSFPAIKPIDEALCKTCHGKSLRPNWEAYSRWEGAYPSDDTEHRGDKYAFPWKSAEHDGFDTFFVRQSKKGRYQFLEGLAEQFVLAVKKRARVFPSQFTQVAGYLNYRRVARLIRNSPGYSRFKYATLGALYDCDNFERMIPASVRESMKRPLRWFIDDTTKLFQADANAYHLRHEESKVAKLRFLYEGRDISTRKWSMSFRRSPYAFVTPGGSPEGFISDALMEKDVELEAYRVWKLTGDSDYGVTTDFVRKWTGSSSDMVRPACNLLREASCSAFAESGAPCE